MSKKKKLPHYTDNLYQYAKYRNALSKIIDEMDSILEDVELPFD